MKNDLSTRQKYLNELMAMCVEHQLHPTQLKSLIRGSYKRWKNDGLSTATNLVLDTQRGLQAKYPEGWL